MRLKGTAEQAIHNLGNGDPAIWLGYQLLREGGGLKVGLTEDAWKSLSQGLELCHTKHGSPLRAIETIRGWISQLGPCYISMDINQAYARISELANTLAFDEIPSFEGIRRHWHQAHIRWEDSQRAQREKLAPAAAPPSRCQNRYQSYSQGKGDGAVEDKEEEGLVIESTSSRVFRGGSFNNAPSGVRSALRVLDVPTYRSDFVGFRPARTLCSCTP
jgi:hypothetical protein